MRLILCLILVGWSVVSAQVSPQEDLDQALTGDAKTAFLATWHQRLHTMQALHLVFTQEKHLAVLRRPLTAQGELWLRGNTLRYVLTNTAGARELELRMDSQAIRAYYPLLHTLEVIDVGAAGTPPIAMPFMQGDAATLERDYDTTVVRQGERYTVRLIPRDAQAPWRELRMTLQDFLPQELWQIDRSGSRVHMHITVFTINPEISEAQLALEVPPDTRITYPLR